MSNTPLSSNDKELREKLRTFQYNQKQGIELTEGHLDYIMHLISEDRKAREAEIKSQGLDEFFDFMEDVYDAWDKYHGNMNLREFAHDFLKRTRLSQIVKEMGESNEK
jgi:hypothetical protein